jgi:hypothetical protein
MTRERYENELTRAAALEAAGEYADAAQVRAWAEQDWEASGEREPADETRQSKPENQKQNRENRTA